MAIQCENGHIACSSCCIKLGNKCPSCSWPIGYNRCRAIEKVIESVKISCINIKYGCNELVSYNKIHDHEKMCVYGPCSCPLSGCNFIGSSKGIFHHFSINHLNSAKRFQYNCLFPLELGVGQRYLILQEQNDHMTFVLNHGVELLGNVVNVICIAPSSTQRGYAYDLIARKEDSSVRLQSFTESIPRWDEHLPLKMFLLVPSDFRGFSGKLKLELCIRPLDAPAPILTGNCGVWGSCRWCWYKTVVSDQWFELGIIDCCYKMMKLASDMLAMDQFMPDHIWTLYCQKLPVRKFCCSIF